MSISLHLRDLGDALVDAWRLAFAGLASVEVSQGDIFSRNPGVVSAHDPIDVRADAVVSPANSFGFMDGGIDAVYTYQLGGQVQERVQAAIRESFDGELGVGQAVIVPTGRTEIPWCISAPTMRVPADVSETVNAYLAFRAVLIAALLHNRSGLPAIRTILCPGLGTAVGRMPVARCARQMRAAWDRILGDKPFAPSTLREAARDDNELLR